LALIGLLALGLVAPDAEWARCLRRSVAVAEELRETGTRGYYEDILDAQAGRQGLESPGGRGDAPPPGWVPFAESGLIDEAPGYLRWRLRPGLDTSWNGLPFRTNRLGHRSPEVDPAKPPGTYRVAVIGSSNTMGHGVAEEATYVRLLEGWLRDRLGRPVEVVNLAVSGDDPAQRLLRLMSEAPRLDPDWVILDATVMDVSLYEIQLAWALAEGVPLPFPYLAEAVRRAGLSAGDGPEATARKVRAVFPELLDGAFAGWAAEARRRGVPATVVVLPRADGRTKAERVRDLLLDLAARHGLDAIDLTDALDGLPLDAYRVSPWDKHPSALGHRRIFEALRDALARRRGVPGSRFRPG
jgi:hypothetical protein